MSNLSLNLVAAAERTPQHTALVCGETTLSYAEFDSAAARVATFLDRAGIEPGDRIGIMLPNTPAFAVVFYGIMRRGAIAVPMNPLLKAREIEFYLSNTGAKALFATPAFAQEATAGAAAAEATSWLVDDASLAELIDGLPEQAAPVSREDHDTAVVLHTSGTTGKPKGAELTHAGLHRNAEVTMRTLVQIGQDDVVMGALPLFHVFGLTCGLQCSVLAGATLALIPRFDADAVMRMIERHDVTVFEGVPTMFSALLAVAANYPDSATATLRICASGGAALPVQVLTDFEKTFGCPILEGYGLSETSPVACFNHPGRIRKAGSIGTPIEGVEMRVVDAEGSVLPTGEAGEIQIRGHNVMKGYWDLPGATAEAVSSDGWFATGDIGKTDDDGMFYIVDRKKQLIIRGGLNVYPREIEEVLYEHPAVAEAAVIGIPHDTLGEEIGAAVALKDGAEAQPEELRDFVKRQVAAYKYPRRVWIVDALPKGPTGKIQRRDITIPEESTR
ncbi:MULTISPECIES: long-chain fatty acid--CoA ligase [unclassified Mycolicibacterium]|uniref:long-chain-fatty-acid--CoA ligase n=1 Tax=unclassified Mycolicibacterium TaxID=2636767 RepID=UPI0012DEC3B5|nr:MULTISPECIES: long-chain fatty acid--CoA ligase [unclassified Mycolicibacterium]MUL83937.1 long-chain fatty acid--CoA ligase [Mycolicibacterium sp. CBMA 329]MUL89997.1 long-chain fatty acid--CoA ligase [Mycolicibacterium sp. CBMA 331]MUL97982.1 long-chain fatty acid--CoA ligase [Mycolicibacterium sp. CBMA 334]MUM27914.1 long-chain fatty acid--CoA ligase [Mycolicibacterium sp. CBMA 295]MUM39512.1 long-chain fatty acid--CoA ligase [Mycolicibacterium sp. CBMA 247]